MSRGLPPIEPKDGQEERKCRDEAGREIVGARRLFRAPLVARRELAVSRHFVEEPPAFSGIERGKGTAEHRQRVREGFLVQPDQPIADDITQVGIMEKDLSCLPEEALEPSARFKRRDRW